MTFIIKRQNYICKILFIAQNRKAFLFTYDKWQINIIFFPFCAILSDNIIIKHIYIRAINPDIICRNIYFPKTSKQEAEQLVLLMASLHNQQALPSFSSRRTIIIHTSQIPHLYTSSQDYAPRAALFPSHRKELSERLSLIR